MKYFTTIIIALFFVSCYPPSIRSKHIPVENVYGTYDLSRDRTITFLKDSTYTYSYPDSCGVMKTEVGVWYYWYSEGSTRNILKAFDMRAVSETGERNHWTEYQTFTFYIKRWWGRIVMSRGLPNDPDGYWYEKIE